MHKLRFYLLLRNKNTASSPLVDFGFWVGSVTEFKARARTFQKIQLAVV